MLAHINVFVDNNDYLQFSEAAPPSLPPPLQLLLPGNCSLLNVSIF